MQHIVEYGKWCENCFYNDKKETDDPCFDCLTEPAKDEGRQPIHYKPKQSGAWCQTCEFGVQSEDHNPCLNKGEVDPKTKKPTCYVKIQKSDKPGKEKPNARKC